MSEQRAIRFRVESNKAKSSYWYTLVSGNGNTTMTSKAKYSSHATAKRAAEDQIWALRSAPLVLEYTTADGVFKSETLVESEGVVSSTSDPLVGPMGPAKMPPEPSPIPAMKRLNPQP